VIAVDSKIQAGAVAQFGLGTQERAAHKFERTSRLISGDPVANAEIDPLIFATVPPQKWYTTNHW
jgi:hypothetical protein